ncbi:MAG: hypothetical protein NVS2B14_01250 [Chamaesiphon sp.]
METTRTPRVPRAWIVGDKSLGTLHLNLDSLLVRHGLPTVIYTILLLLEKQQEFVREFSPQTPIAEKQWNDVHRAIDNLSTAASFLEDAGVVYEE